MKKISVCLSLVFLLIICFSINLFRDDSKKDFVVSYGNDSLLINIDGSVSTTLPSDSSYYLTDYVCNNPNTLVSWDNDSLELSVSNSNKGGGVSCELTFNSKPLLSMMKVGSYVSYVGEGGTVGDDSLNCRINGSPSYNISSEEAESPNSCLGENAYEDLELSNSNTYGYCSSSNYKYYTTGFRIAYINNGKVMLVSAGSPECIKGDSSIGNSEYIKLLNTRALKYCNSDFVDGDCFCEDIDNDGLCDDASSDAWAIGDSDFYYITKAISGYGKRLTDFSSSLGDTGGVMDFRYCYSSSDSKYSYSECGYNNDLLDNGGFYWFSALGSDTEGILWSPTYRGVDMTSFDNSYGLRPIISLSSTVYVVGGNGTLESPYLIAN